MTPSPDAARRLSGLDELAELWRPRSAATDVRPGHDMVIVAGRRAPRLLVPGWQSRAAAAATMRSGVSGSFRERAQRGALAAVLRAGLGRRLFPAAFATDPSSDDSLVGHVTRLVGGDVVASVALTPARANRKPVLHLLDSNGRSIAFVKVGVNELTRDLVARETDVLETLSAAAPSSFDLPGVLHEGTFDRYRYLVLSPLPSWRGRPVDADRLATAMRELGGLATVPAVVDDYLSDLTARLNAVEPSDDPRNARAAEALRAAVDAVRGPASETDLALGRWHGDWTAWNCSKLDDRVLVWDWERSTTPAPLGFDALHYAVQSQIAAGGELRDIASDCLAGAPSRLAAWSIGAEAARLVATLYLLDIAVRYVADDQLATGGRAGDVGSWIIPVLQAELDTRGKDTRR